MKRFAPIFIFILIYTCLAYGQVKDTQAVLPKDTLVNAKHISNYGALLDSCMFLNHTGKPQNLLITTFKPFNYMKLFYTMAFLLLLFGIFKAYFQRYFDTLLSVFFNTTFKQNQLTDQLMQAKLPSLIFNMLFVIFAGTYSFCLTEFLNHKKIDIENFKFKYLLLAIFAIGICYFVKYIMLILVGWITNLKQEAKSYIFIIFLLNKILGIFLLILLPFIIFGNTSLSSFAVLLSIVGIVLAFLLRYYRSFSQLKAKLSISLFHFILLVCCLEVLPIGIIFKFCSILLNTKA